jgi:hypothetical protein
MLERYHLGDLTPEEKAALETRLGGGASLAELMADLERSDRDILSRYPAQEMVTRINQRLPGSRFRGSPRLGPRARGLRFGSPLAWGICAAALTAAVVLPSLLFLANRPGRGEGLAENLTDRIKGNRDGYLPDSNPDTGLYVYLKNDTAAGGSGDGFGAVSDVILRDYAVLQAGNTIQLAYAVNTAPPEFRPAASAAAFPRERYGVIFSIDGRAAVTLHYPYTPGQSTRLVSGKLVPLKEAYTLDDAPDFEIFFFVISDKPLDSGTVLKAAEQLALDPAEAVERSESVFGEYEVRSVTLRKE